MTDQPRALPPPSSMERMPPADVKTEHAVCAALLANPEVGVARARLRLAPEDFYDARLRAIYAACLDIWHVEGELDVLLLNERLRYHGEPEPTIELAWQLSGDAVSAANVSMHAGRLAKLAMARRAQDRMRGAVEALYTDTDPAGEVAEVATELRKLAASGPTSADHADASAVMAQSMEAYQSAEQLAQSGKQFAGKSCGFPDLDLKLNGLMPAESTVIGADTSVGKSTLAAQMALGVLKEGGSVGWISQEEPRYRVGLRFAGLASDVVIDPDLARRGKLPQLEREALEESCRWLQSKPWWVFDDCRHMDQIEHQMRARDGVDLWVIDHIHRTRGHGDSDHERITDVVQRGQDLALDLGCHVLMPAQLHRVKDRPDRRPRLEDLRASGSIEEHAVNVILIYRPGRYDHLREAARKSKDPDAYRQLMSRVDILCEKLRYGPIGTVPMTWIGREARFGSIARHQEEEERWTPNNAA